MHQPVRPRIEGLLFRMLHIISHSLRDPIDDHVSYRGAAGLILLYFRHLAVLLRRYLLTFIISLSYRG